ncbi:MAG: copper homeostasis protein CutC [Cytophagales bacterium]|mgnify:FL=1|nr:MAG: copper homeostasis protein CutC [Rhodothermaeota bacterium MED-G16]
MTRILEVCSFNQTDFNKIIKHKVSRVELCVQKEVGGLTPPRSDIEYAVSKNIPIHPIIRTRPGNFTYNRKELNEMIDSVKYCRDIGCKGVVLGILDKSNAIDYVNCKRLVKESKGISLTFHMAFDLTRDPFLSMEKIIDLGFDRILTSGQKESAVTGIKLINELAEKGEKRISIMPGSSVRSSNIDLFLQNKLINEFHSSCYINNKFSEKELKLISIAINKNKD